MSASDTSHIPMLMTEGQGYLDTYVCCQEPHQDVDQWCFTFKQYEIDNADNDQCQKTNINHHLLIKLFTKNGWTATKLKLVALLISLLSRSSCSDQMNYVDSCSWLWWTWQLSDVWCSGWTGRAAEEARPALNLRTSELLNTTFKTIYSTSTSLNSTTKLFSNIVISSFNSASCVPDVISAFTQILQCYLWTFHAQKCSSMWFPVMPK